MCVTILVISTSGSSLNIKVVSWILHCHFILFAVHIYIIHTSKFFVIIGLELIWMDSVCMHERDIINHLGWDRSDSCIASIWRGWATSYQRKWMYIYLTTPLGVTHGCPVRTFSLHNPNCSLQSLLEELVRMCIIPSSSWLTVHRSKLTLELNLSEEGNSWPNANRYITTLFND